MFKDYDGKMFGVSINLSTTYIFILLKNFKTKKIKLVIVLVQSLNTLDIIYLDFKIIT